MVASAASNTPRLANWQSEAFPALPGSTLQEAATSPPSGPWAVVVTHTQPTSLPPAKSAATTTTTLLSVLLHLANKMTDDLLPTLAMAPAASPTASHVPATGPSSLTLVFHPTARPPTPTTEEPTYS